MEDFEVLIVDDEECLLYVLKEVARHLKIKCLTATSVNQALSYVRQYSQLKCVIVDNNLSQKNLGITLIKHIKQLRPELYCILMSGSYIEVENEADVVIDKPFHFEILFEIIRENCL